MAQAQEQNNWSLEDAAERQVEDFFQNRPNMPELFIFTNEDEVKKSAYKYSKKIDWIEGVILPYSDTMVEELSEASKERYLGMIHEKFFEECLKNWKETMEEQKKCNDERNHILGRLAFIKGATKKSKI